MLPSLRALARLAASTAILLVISPAVVGASDLMHKEPTFGQGCQHVYSREGNHGLIHYSGATYWSSERGLGSWGATNSPTVSAGDIAPSPWAYRTIAPRSRQYHFFYGDSYGWGDCHDCHN